MIVPYYSYSIRVTFGMSLRWLGGDADSLMDERRPGSPLSEGRLVVDAGNDIVF